MIGIIGCGNMGGALIKGLRSKFKSLRLITYDKDKAKLLKVKSLYRVKAARSLKDLVGLSKTVIIAVKPQDIKPVLEAVKQEYSNQLVISIAAGISTSFIEKSIKRSVPVIRVMPNLAARISMSVSVLSKGKFAANSHITGARKIFSSVGVCMVLSEKYMDAATAISGSGPGYIYYFLYCLQCAAAKLGFSEDKSKFLVLNTAKGAVQLISQRDDFLDLASKVASKGGTTQAALRHLEQKKIKKIVAEAAKRARRRARDLAK